MAGLSMPGPLGSDTNRPVVDSQTNALVNTPPPGPAGGGGDRNGFERELHLLEAELANFGARATWDGALRVQYARRLADLRAEAFADVRAGRRTWAEAAAQAKDMRNDIIALTRRASHPIGRAEAERLKPQPRSLNWLVGKKTGELFGAQARFAELSAEQQARVYAAIVESAGKADPKVMARMARISRAGRALLILSLAISVYTVATADDKVAAAEHEGAVTLGGIGGGVAGGAIAGLACGPGAPVCVTVGAFVGGALAAFGVDYFWTK